MNIVNIGTLIEAMQAGGVHELEIVLGFLGGLKKVRITMDPPSSPPNSIVSVPTQEVKSNTEENLLTINSPMVGTFYRAPSKEADPYVKIGDAIKSGDPVCIVEAMKLMNEIRADKNGIITKVLIKDGDPVEYDTPLFKVKPN